MIRSFLDKLKSYIEISNFERRGVFALLFSCLLISGYYYYKNTRSYDDPAFSADSLSAYENHLDSVLGERKVRENRYPEKVTSHARQKESKVYTAFNPNTYSESQLKASGVPRYVVSSILKYRSKGGSFKNKQDFKKLYVVSDELFLALEPYLLLPALEEHIAQTQEKESSETFKKVKKVIDLNSASLDDLISLRGIGDTYAKRIIKFRDLLGGFISKEQIKEVYGLSAETYEMISEFIIVDTKHLQSIKVNLSSYEELAKHPYISFKKAKAIVSYREQHGYFKSEADLRKLHSLSRKDVDRILPYLDLN